MKYYSVTYSDSLSHHGIKGQKWGVRRFQNEDGSYTDEGQKRRGLGSKIKSKWKKYRKERKQARAIQKEVGAAREKYEEKANKKYDVDYRRKQMQYEQANRNAFNSLGVQLAPDYHPAADKYNEAIRKRDEEVSKKLIKEFGQEKYNTMVREDTRDGLIVATSMLAAFGTLAVAGEIYKAKSGGY